MKLGHVYAVILFTSATLSSVAQSSTTSTACSKMTLGANGALNGFIPSANDAWHQDISTAPVDPTSNTIITTSGDLAGAHLHADFSSIAGGDYGIPYEVVDSAETPLVAVPINLYPSESDITLAPVPATAPVEGNPGLCPSSSGDRHLIVIDRNTCVAYEYWKAAYCDGGWSAAQGTVWDYTTTEKRPYSFTSADAAGLSVFEGLIRYDEIVAGSIQHAIRFTANHTKDDHYDGYFTAPATHAAGNLWGTDNIIGMRIRLKASFDISGFSATNQIILKAMKKYGMILADNGSNMYFQGTPDARWNDSDLHELGSVPSSAFDVVQMATAYDASTAPKGAAPVIHSFTASASSVSAGTKVTLTPVVTGGSYSVIDQAGFVRTDVSVTPTATTTYTVISRNAFGSASASTTVTVGASSPRLVFEPIANVTYGASAFKVTATSNSVGAISYAVASGPATISGSTVRITGAGNVTISATQAAKGSYTSTAASATFTVAPATPTFSFIGDGPSEIRLGVSFTMPMRTDSTGAVTYTILSGSGTVSGNTITITGGTSITLQAKLAATSNYAAAVATIQVTLHS